MSRMSLLDSSAGKEDVYARDKRENFRGYLLNRVGGGEVSADDVSFATKEFDLRFSLLV